VLASRHARAPPDLLGGQGRRGHIEDPVHDGRGGARSADRHSRCAGEVKAGEPASGVEGPHRRPGEPFGAAGDGEQPRPVAGAREHEHEVGGGAVEHEPFLAAQRPAVGGPGRLGAEGAGAPRPVRLGDGERCGGLARGDSW